MTTQTSKQHAASSQYTCIFTINSITPPPPPARCTNLTYPRYIGTDGDMPLTTLRCRTPLVLLTCALPNPCPTPDIAAGTCLQPSQTYTGCSGWAYYVPSTFKTCEYVFTVAQPPLLFQIEEWYYPLQFFGACSGWAPRSMTLVADYTYTISLPACQLLQEFMFVPQFFGGNTTLCPKLGCFNWKQGKIGVGLLDTSGAALQPGGGSGFLPASGDYNLTLYTNHPSPALRFTLKFAIANAKPSLAISGTKSVTNAAAFPVIITASQPTIFNASCVVVKCPSSSSSSSSSSCSWSPNFPVAPPYTSTTFTITINVNTSSSSPSPSGFIITITVTNACLLTSAGGGGGGLPVEVASWWEVLQTLNHKP